MKTLINKIKPSTIIKVYKVYNKIKALINRFNPIAFTKVLKSLEDRIYYLDNENNKYHNELIQLNDKIFKLDEGLSRDIYDLNIENRDYLGLCKRNDNKLNNKIKTLKEHIKSVEKLVNELCELNQLNKEV